MAERVLVVVAHPDDESFWCGGTLAMCGQSVTVVALTDGVGSRFALRRSVAEVQANQQRLRQFSEACGRHLGVSVAETWHVFEDQRSDRVAQVAINQAVAALVRQHDWSRVFTHHVGDLNLDHRRTAEAVLVATRGSCPVWMMRPEWSARCVGPAWEPTEHIALTVDALERKVHACLCYTDELRPYPHPRSEQAIRETTVESFMVIHD